MKNKLSFALVLLMSVMLFSCSNDDEVKQDIENQSNTTQSNDKPSKRDVVGIGDDDDMDKDAGKLKPTLPPRKK